MSPHDRPRRVARRAGALLVLGAALVVLGCDTPVGAPTPRAPDPPADPPSGERIVFIVSHPDSLNGSEKAIRDRAATLLEVSVVTIDEHVFRTEDLEACVLVLISKNVDDDVLGAAAKPARCGILFWEENQQQLRMLATMDNDGSDGGVWHTRGRTVHVRAEAPVELRADVSGEVDLYDREDEMSFGRREQVPESAIVVAEYARPGDHKVIYAYEAGAVLADGTSAAGRRVFFGLYRDNFHHLTEEGVRLFDAALLWAADSAPGPGSE